MVIAKKSPQCVEIWRRSLSSLWVELHSLALRRCACEVTIGGLRDLGRERKTWGKKGDEQILTLNRGQVCFANLRLVNL